EFALQSKEPNYPVAEQAIAKGAELHPKDYRFYLFGARIADAQKNHEEAKRRLEQGLQQAKSNPYLLEASFHQQLQDGDPKGARVTLKQLNALKNPTMDWPAHCSFLEGQLMMAEGNFREASQRFKAVRSRLSTPELQNQADLYLMRCYN